MYKPAPPRPKKTSIVRSRNGCKSCRERKSKCDEKQPVCGTCSRLGKKCERYQPQFKFQSVYPATQGAGASSTVNRGIEKDDHDLQPITRRKSTYPQEVENPSSIGNLDLIRSLQHSERNIFYSTIWEDHCLPAMHPVFQTLSNGFFDHSILADASLALSSCSFSRLYPERKSLATSEMGSLCPDLVHQTRSQLYYSSAIRKVAALSENECYGNVFMVLTVLIIFGYIEGSMGNFQGFYCHDQGIISLLSNLQLSPEKNLNALLAAWLQIRIVVWWARVNFCSLEVLRTLPSVMPPGITIEGFDRPQDRRVTVLSNMCESHQSNFSALLRHWDSSDLNVHTEKTHLEDEEIEMISNFLAEQGNKLDKWIESLPSSEFPINWPTDSQYFGDVDSQEAIFFHSNEAALNFAYYALGRIMQCTGLLQSLRAGCAAVSYDFHAEEFWTRLLLRIARGTNMETLLRMNSYTIGLSGLLLTALLRCQSQELGLEIQSWLQDLEAMKSTEEGAFPLYQTLRVVKTINRQKMAERDVVAVTLSVDDEGGTPKFNAYNSQPITGLLFHGIIKSSGELFTDYLLVDL